MVTYKKKRILASSDYSDYDVPSKSSHLSSRQIYDQELANKRYQEKIRQSQIKARARNILDIRRVREERDTKREQRRKKIELRKNKKYAKDRVEAERENMRRNQKKKAVK